MNPQGSQIVTKSVRAAFHCAKVPSVCVLVNLTPWAGPNRVARLTQRRLRIDNSPNDCSPKQVRPGSGRKGICPHLRPSMIPGQISIGRPSSGPLTPQLVNLTNWLVKYAKSAAPGKHFSQMLRKSRKPGQNREHSCRVFRRSQVPCYVMDAKANPTPQTWRVTITYDGTDFQGWQVQPGLQTIQGELQAALGRVTGETPLPQGSGRTDAGVHALAQVASFQLLAPIPPENLLYALNRTLPPSIRVSEARIARSESFHARHSAVAKTYEYRVLCGSDCSPFLARYVYCCPWTLDLVTLQTAARAFIGEHDFKSFAANDPDAAQRNSDLALSDLQNQEKTIRTIFSSGWEERTIDSADLLVYRVRGNGFLHHMVRNLVGTMIDAGRGFLPLEEIPKILAARSRSAAGPTAPARGLFLVSIEYPPDED